VDNVPSNELPPAKYSKAEEETTGDEMQVDPLPRALTQDLTEIALGEFSPATEAARPSSRRVVLKATPEIIQGFLVGRNGATVEDISAKFDGPVTQILDELVESFVISK